MANFRTKARAVDLLGKNQIADLPTAITELWKNGYDAYGDYLSAGLYQKGYGDVYHTMFVISDDGYGMSEKDILNKWVVIGTDHKKEMDEIPSLDKRFYKKQRVLLGEKGIGRLSVAYLGSHMLMITKTEDSEIQLLFMNWDILGNYDMYLDEVEIPTVSVARFEDLDSGYTKLLKEFQVNFQSKSWDKFPELLSKVEDSLKKYAIIPKTIKTAVSEHFREYGHGTLFLIFDPIDELTDLGRENEEAMKEDREQYAEHTDFIRSALAGLFNPFDNELIAERKTNLRHEGDIYLTPALYIYNSDGTSYNFLQIKDFFTWDEFDECEHWIKGKFDLNGTFHGHIKTYNNKILEYSYTPRFKMRVKIGEIELKLAFWEAMKQNTIMTDQKFDQYEKKAENFSGLYIYRDGFRVLPYGRTDFDFLEFEKQRSKSAGIYYFSHRKMFGYLGISRTENPKLIDKSGREGLVGNDAYRSMKNLLKDFFNHIALELFGTKSKGRTEFLQDVQRRKVQNDLIEQEKRRNHRQLSELNKQMRENQKVLEKVEQDINKLQKELNNQMEFQKIAKAEEKVILAQIRTFQMRVIGMKISLNPDMSFEGNDRIRDSYYLYEENRMRLGSTLDELNQQVMSKAYHNSLAREYEDKYQSMQEKVYELLKNCKLQLENAVEGFRKEVLSEISKWESRFREMMPARVKIDELSEEDTVKYIRQLDDDYEEVLEVCNQKLSPYIESIAAMHLYGTGLSLLEAYKSKEIALSKKLDLFYELAQVGMSIDVVDHQFNVLYSQISTELQNLKKKAASDQTIEMIYHSLIMSFQHMESNHKMLMPLYRNTRKSKKDIFGEDIQKIILNFYQTRMEKDGIKFICTENFLCICLHTYESILIPVFINIINNAIYWLGFSDNRIIKIDIKGKDILIMNSGPVMTFTELTRCFELFYSKKPSGRGIGLYLAKRNLNAVHMDIYATNDQKWNQLNGVCFVITQGEIL